MYLPHGAIMEQWTPAAEGRELRADADPQAARAVPETADDRQRTREQAGDRAAGARAQPGHLAELRDAARERRSRTAASPSIRSPPRTSARTRRCRRSKSRPKAAAATAAPATATSAAATATPSRSGRRPRRCRWKPIRASCSSGCSARATRRRSARRSPSSTRAFSTSSPPKRPISASTLDPQDKAQARRLSRERARDRAARPEDGRAGSVQPGPARRSRRQHVRSAPEPDVRHDRAGLPGQPDARLQLHDGGRRQQPDLQPHRRLRRVPSAVAPPERQGAGRRSWSRSRPTTARRSPSSWPSSRRCPTATARCWITRSCSTAAT